MRHLFKIAYRDLLRNRRRSILTALAIALSLGLLILTSGFSTGETVGALNATIRLQTGHLQVREESYEEEKLSLKWEDLLKNPRRLIEDIQSIQGVRDAAPQLWASGIIPMQDESVNVQIIGIDPQSTVQDPIRESLVAGEFLSSKDRNSVLIGQKLARDLGLNVGDEINLTTSTSNGHPEAARFTIRGLYNTGASGYDETTVFMPFNKAQTITRAEDHASVILVVLYNREQAETVATQIHAPGAKILTWRELNKLLLQAEQMSDAYMAFINIIILAMGATVIVNTLLMSVFERTREIGVLASIGMKSGQILSMFLVEASLLGIVGIMLGNIIGALVTLYFVKEGLYVGDMGVTGMIYTDTLYASFSTADMVSLSIATIIITLIAGLYPAWMAARLEPTAALRAD